MKNSLPKESKAGSKTGMVKAVMFVPCTMESKLTKGLVPIRTLPHISYDDKKAPRVTRSSDNQPCACFWCRVARMYGKEYMDHCNSVRPRPVKSPPKPDTIKICSKCKGVIHQGGAVFLNLS